MQARQQAQNAKFINALRNATAAIETFGIGHDRYPPNSNRGVVPQGIASYLAPTLDWTVATPVGGPWDWEFDVMSVIAAVAVVEPFADVEQMTEIHRK